MRARNEQLGAALRRIAARLTGDAQGARTRFDWYVDAIISDAARIATHDAPIVFAHSRVEVEPSGPPHIGGLLERLLEMCTGAPAYVYPGSGARIIVENLDGEPDEELELSALESLAYGRLLSLLGFDPLVAHIQRSPERREYGLHDEDGEVIASGSSIGETIIDALYRRAFDSQVQLSELRQDVFALQRAARKLGLGE